MENIVTKVIYGQPVSFNIDLFDEDIIKSVKLYLSIKDDKYRSFCPFVMKHATCEDICGQVFWLDTMEDKECPKTVLTKDMLYGIIKEIFNLSEVKIEKEN